ncbi:MAG TPA: peptidoglycan DD-metalloendopeptidase family protein [Acidobacteriota bacterium]|nr:peptidoglycan DD-metalloendopeptidase family protein [Acidobacteriota bacterium]HQO25336.1 peptidoglycan DD-metalloendopeptidase family protein [Acidobacteriota bacterium]
MTLKRIALLLTLTLGLTGALGVLVQRAGAGDERVRVVAPAAPPEAEARPRAVREAIQPRTVIGDYLSRYGVLPGEMDLLLGAVRPVYDLTMIRAGHFLDFQLTGDGRLESFRYGIDADGFLQVDRTESGWMAVRKPHPYTFTDCCAAGVITDHLFGAIAVLGEEPQLAVALAELFAWDVDFYADLREGDSFRILFQKRLLNGQPAGYGPILAAEFVNQNQAYRAFRYVHADGKAEYYTPAGESVRKELLKSPLKMGRLTSRFSHRRRHPTLKVYRPHLGIDIAAPVGTPVHAAGEGIVTFAGYRGQAGRMIEVRHAHRFTTQYLHLSRYAAGIRPGARIRQGQVIGYVGSSGESTGPHLDYRIKQNNAYVNPLKTQFQRAEPLPADRLPEFQRLVVAYGRVLGVEGELQQYYLARLWPADEDPFWARQAAR